MEMTELKKKKRKFDKFLTEFKNFALRGNVIDLAVGVIIGGAFQKIVASLVENILTPFITIFGGTQFTEWSFKIMNANINFGKFITEIINFIIMAFVVFLLVKFINQIASIAKPADNTTAPAEKTCPYCISKIPEAATRCPNCTSVLEEDKPEMTSP